MEPMGMPMGGVPYETMGMPMGMPMEYEMPMGLYGSTGRMPYLPVGDPYDMGMGLHPSMYYSNGAMFPPEVVQSQVYGVGCVFGEKKNAETGKVEVFVKQVYKDGPADESGKVNVGDTLIRVNEDDVTGQSLQQLRRVVPGPLNSKVNLTFSRDNGAQMYDVELTRSATSGGIKPRERHPIEDLTQKEAPVQQAMPGFSFQKSEENKDDIVVANVTPGSDAETAGMQFNEKLIEIEGQQADTLTEQQLKDMLTGDYGSTIKLKTNLGVREVKRDCESDRPPKAYKSPQDLDLAIQKLAADDAVWERLGWEDMTLSRTMPISPARYPGAMYGEPMPMRMPVIRHGAQPMVQRTMMMPQPIMRPQPVMRTMMMPMPVRHPVQQQLGPVMTMQAPPQQRVVRKRITRPVVRTVPVPPGGMVPQGSVVQAPPMQGPPMQGSPFGGGAPVQRSVAMAGPPGPPPMLPGRQGGWAGFTS